MPQYVHVCDVLHVIHMISLAEKFVSFMIVRIFAASVPAKPLNDAQMCGDFLCIYAFSLHTPRERPSHFMKT